MHESLDEFKFRPDRQIPSPTPELSAFERLKN